ncbi:alkaline phosphatase-like protein [Russula earlei]|uniref:Alkaline phosphatase-like protein n=1 Tax=Russula earlei TaxID=71964 RepID=A0ACC0U110_9AGAM|nr:alkaline phosphatase-like protein [Russula earlei]
MSAESQGNYCLSHRLTDRRSCGVTVRDRARRVPASAAPETAKIHQRKNTYAPISPHPTSSSIMTTSSGPIARFLVLGILFHLVYIGTVFDCYFTTPIVHGMRQYKLPQAQAKRLVLIVGDGLRADFAFSSNASRIVPGVPERVAPYLREIIENRGAYGVSHTRVPTESRPGHVAIIGGMYEDVSAVTKGWKANPVDFDSVFNQSSHTFSFGSPDIVPMFVQGATPGKVEGWSYHEDDEDFTKDATTLDLWVLDQLKYLLRNATTNKTLDAHLRAPQVVFFLHLLGLDTTGHSYRPHSKEYMNNIHIVDDIVRETEQLISEFYDDQETSYIFTADHGMSKIGNHGDGDPDNTRTPLVAWGAGIRGPIKNLASHPMPDDFSAPWELSHIVRRDVEQADVAALMSALLGTHWPVNSVGVLPDVDPHKDGYLSMRGGDREIAEAAVVNAKVVLEHYRMKHELRKAHAILYRPYEFLDHSSTLEYPGSQRISFIEGLIASGYFKEARHHSYKLIKATLGGLRYLETYDRTLIRTIVTFAYTGWIAFSAAFILAPQPPPGGSAPLWIPSIFGLAAAGSCALFAIQRLPWTLHIYILFPFFFWQDVTRKIYTNWSTLRGYKLDAKWVASTLFKLLMTVLTLQGMVSGYTNRGLWSVGFIVIGVVWPLTSWPKGTGKLLVPWSVCCIVTAMFPLLAVDPSESLRTILAGGMCMLFVGELAVRKVSQIETTASAHAAKLNFELGSRIQLLFTALSMLNTAASVQSLQARLGLPLLNQVAGWMVFALASIFPFFLTAPRTAEARLLAYFLSFCPCFVVLSIRAEGLFYLSYCVTLYLWTLVEKDARREKARYRTIPNGTTSGSTWNHWHLSLDDVRIALFFLFFVQVGFFGTGKSFYLEPVYRLVPIFSPFLMATLLVSFARLPGKSSKSSLPFVFLSAAFATLNSLLGMPPFALFLVALSLTDVMTMTFFFNVTDTGSWLQIGQSISHFCITSLLLVFSAGIASLGETLMRGSVLRHRRLEAKREEHVPVDDDATFPRLISFPFGHVSAPDGDVTKRYTKLQGALSAT